MIHLDFAGSCSVGGVGDSPWLLGVASRNLPPIQLQIVRVGGRARLPRLCRLAALLRFPRRPGLRLLHFLCILLQF